MTVETIEERPPQCARCNDVKRVLDKTSPAKETHVERLVQALALYDDYQLLEIADDWKLSVPRNWRGKPNYRLLNYYLAIIALHEGSHAFG